MTRRFRNSLALLFGIWALTIAGCKDIDPALQGSVDSLLDADVPVDEAAAQIQTDIDNIFADARTIDEALKTVDDTVTSRLNAGNLQSFYERNAELSGFIAEPSQTARSRSRQASARKRAASNSLSAVQHSAIRQAQQLLQNGGTSLVPPAAAELCPGSEDPSRTVVIYVNGINNLYPNAYADAHILRQNTLSVLPEASVTHWYNTSTESEIVDEFGHWEPLPPGDLGLEALNTAIYEISATLASAANSIVAGVAAIIGTPLDVTEAIRVKVVDWFQWNDASSAASIKANSLATLLEQQVRSGNKVVVVAHSHGNNVTDRALRILETRFPATGASDVVTQTKAFGALGVVMVGSPRTTMYRVSPAYITNPGDCVPSFGGVPPNSLSVKCFTELHSFAKAYMGNTSVLGNVLSALVGYDQSLVPATSTVGQGIVQATLTWDTAGDIDLYVREPTGTIVYYANKTGDVGQLDVDNTVAYGPENYYICGQNTVQQGVYDVGVNYYAGSVASVPWRVSVKAGNRVETFSGNISNPNHGANIIYFARVVYNGQTFTIQPLSNRVENTSVSAPSK
ncbi:MAG TPA: hypothetical protein VFG20_23380 [Planctomycetaceae bacterium]|nr:hypothetical protein [Planctomycetaceae bacterium]